MAIMGVPMLLGPILGPILGGWLVTDVSWRWIFFINLPIGIAALVLAFRILPETWRASTRRVWTGSACCSLSPGLALMIFGLAESSTTASAPSRCWAPLARRGRADRGLRRHSWRAAAPLIDIRTFTHTRGRRGGGHVPAVLRSRSSARCC